MITLYEWLDFLWSRFSLYWFIQEWWESLSFAYQIFFGIGLGASLILVFQILLQLIGIGDGFEAMEMVDAEGMDAADAEGGRSAVGVFSFRTITAFFAGFGWAGAIATDSGLTVVPSALIASATGMVFMGAVYGMLVFLLSLQTSGTVHYANAVGEVGDVYIPIPPNRSDPGKIQVKVQGRLRTISAYNASDIRLESHSKVKVIDQIDSNTVLVEPLSASDDHTTHQKERPSEET